MHYVDEGTGDPVLLLHGNPTWGFLYREVIGPLNAVADVEGCKVENGRVVTPRGFKDAWKSLYAAGWKQIAGARAGAHARWPHRQSRQLGPSARSEAGYGRLS